MRLTVYALAAAVFALLSQPQEALAWGPATHVGLGSTILSQLALLPAAVAAILARHGIAYLYGNIAADIVFAKRLSRVKQFCHHWSTAYRLLDNADDDRGRAFAYGYLSHLAADTIAHGKYVPRQVVVSDCSVHFGHFFWELRADATETRDNLRLLDAVLRQEHGHHHTELENHITGTFLPYDVNRLIFDRMNALAVNRNFRLGVETWNRVSRWYLPPELMEGYRSECLDRIHSILAEGKRSALLRDDPNGTSALMQAKVRKRESRRLKRRGLPTHRRIHEATLSLAPTPNGHSAAAPAPAQSTIENRQSKIGTPATVS